MQFNGGMRVALKLRVVDRSPLELKKYQIPRLQFRPRSKRGESKENLGEEGRVDKMEEIRAKK